MRLSICFALRVMFATAYLTLALTARDAADRLMVPFAAVVLGVVVYDTFDLRRRA